VVDWGGGVLAIAATAGPMFVSTGSRWPHLPWPMVYCFPEEVQEENQDGQPT